MGIMISECRLKLPILAIICCLAFLFQAPDTLANPGWKTMKGHSACGGLDARGNLQEPCGHRSAKFESKAVGKCPAGSFFDIGTWSCYTCPGGYNRNARAVTHARACEKPVTPRTAPAKFEGKGECPKGAFSDPRNGGECWSCPDGYGRTANKVDKWNACGMVGKKAVSAEFKGRLCAKPGSFWDPRGGGECWSCAEDYQRTAAPVTANSACKITLNFAPATQAAALTCPAGEHFDFIDGGTCWSCGDGETRTWSSVKGPKACRSKRIEWAVPDRAMPGLFGLGKGADDILAKLIADRRKIDNAIKEAASIEDADERVALENAWKVIDTTPWDSPYLGLLLQETVIRAAAKAPAEWTDSERDLLTSVAAKIQANRQFIAYQAKQAYETWIIASRKFYDERTKHSGAAIIYSSNQLTPPDYNQMVADAVQISAGVAAPLGNVLLMMFSPSFRDAVAPYRKMQKKAAVKASQYAFKNILKESTKQAIKKALTKAFEKVGSEALKQGLKALASGSLSSTAAAAITGPAIIVVGAAVILTMEMDKFAALKEAEGKIRQAITIADRPVDLNLLFQQEDGLEEFQFHWMSLTGADTQPSAHFKARLTAYKSGTPQQMPGTITLTSSTHAGGALEAALKAQKKRPDGAVRMELSAAAGLCLDKQPGASAALALADCKDAATPWLSIDQATKELRFAGKYCVTIDGAKLSDGIPVVLKDCQATTHKAWLLQVTGQINPGKLPALCITADAAKPAAGAPVLLKLCNPGKRHMQTWRPWPAR
ncbi:MAG: ricin-type beta-trefoil lectin domain protein [Rhodospirillales bacterium]